jgi:uncharacterized protein (DUF58 family)
MPLRLVLLSLVLFGALLLGLVLVNGNLVALAIPLAVYLAAVLFHTPDDFRLSARRTLSSEAITQGQEVKVSLAITNEGDALDELLVEDAVPPQLEVITGEPRVIIALKPGETYRLEYSLRTRRGSFSLDTAFVYGREAFGLFQRSMTLSAPAKLLVMPEVQRVRQVKIRPRRTRDYAGPVPSRQGGAGVDFFSLRDYQPGDPLRWLNWKATARHEESLFTNQFEIERIADVGLILDARQQSDIPHPVASLFEYSVRVTASLADVFLNAGNRVGLLIYGRGQERTFPGYGKVQRERILRALGSAQPTENYALQNLAYLPTRFFPARSQIVMISPLRSEDLPVLVRLRALDYSLLVVCPDPVSFEASLYADSPLMAQAERIARLERTLLLHKLQRAGIQTINWKVTQPFDQVAYAALGRMPRGVHAIGRVS